jgi:membrane protein DedA with SNARE-associated domain
MLDFIVDTVWSGFLTWLGAVIKRSLGRPLSKSGTSEAWIGLFVVLIIVAITVAIVRSN